jgi:hypothetical protein
MPVSQNGYSANDRSVITTHVVTQDGRRLALRVGPPGEMLAHCIRWFDENIRNIDPGILDDWGYAERPIRGGSELSNHASGTAADVDATQWPLGAGPESYLSAAEIAKLRSHLRVYQGCIRWGGDYIGRKDPMHFEINRDAATVARVWTQIKGASAPTPTPQEDDMIMIRNVSTGDVRLVLAGKVIPVRTAPDHVELQKSLKTLNLQPALFNAIVAAAA